MKKHEQVVISNDAVRRTTEVFYCGAARCPYCNTLNEAIFIEKKSRIAVINPQQRCKHSNMAVDAGNLQIAIHFEN